MLKSVLFLLCSIIISLYQPSFSFARSVPSYFFTLFKGTSLHGDTAYSAVTKIKNLPIDNAIKQVRHLPLGSRMPTMLSLAIEKGCVSEIEALRIMTTLKKYERYAQNLASKGAHDNLSKLEDYQGILLKNVLNGKKLSVETITMQTQQLRNGGIAGTRHAVTNVLFDDAGFPIFDSIFSVRMPSTMYTAKDSMHFNYATKQLSKHITSNPSFARQFSSENIQRIHAGFKPKGYTWHHSQKNGVLELVDTNIHQKTSHRGGRAIWGGGGSQR